MNRLFVRSGSIPVWRQFLGLAPARWRQNPSYVLAATSWEAAEGNLPPEVSRSFDASGIEDIQSLRLLLAVPDWEFDVDLEGMAPQPEMLALARNSQGLCAIAVEPDIGGSFGWDLGAARDPRALAGIARMQEILGVEISDLDASYQLLYRTCCAVRAAEEFNAQSAVMLVHSFGTTPRPRQEFERFCMSINADVAGDDIFIVSRCLRPRLILAWCKAGDRFSQQLWDPAQLAFPTF